VKIPGLLHRWILIALKPVTKLMGKIHFAPHARKILAHDVIAIEDAMLPGDGIITFSEGELTNYFIDGEYKHCAMYLGQGQVIEAVGKGVVITDLEDFCASKDKICVVRPKFCTFDERLRAVKYALTQVGTAYDYEFNPNVDSFYCAELYTQALQMATSFTSPFFPREVMGMMTVLPVDFKLATKKFEIVIERPIG